MNGDSMSALQAIDNSEAWRQIPPEEKLEMLAKAQSRGISAAALGIMVCAMVSLAFKVTWPMWLSMITAPFVYQFAAGKAWRALRPRAMLEYLAARSVARRYAFNSGSKSLVISLIMRGRYREEFSANVEGVQQALEASLHSSAEAEVWIALFHDALILLREKPGGAELTVGAIINEKVSLESTDGGGYTNEKELLFRFRDKLGMERTYRISSRHPAALAVLEKKFLQIQNQQREEAERSLKAPSLMSDSVI